MLGRLRPLDLKLVFEDRPYELGETVDLNVDLKPQTNVMVREGRIDLVCEERYQQFYKGPMIKERRHIFKAGMMRGLMSDNPGPRRGTISVPSYFYTEEVMKNRKKSYVHSSVTFLSNARLGSGIPASYSAELEIRPEPPQHLVDLRVTEGKVNWMLVATIDVVHARDITRIQPVKVTQPL